MGHLMKQNLLQNQYNGRKKQWTQRKRKIFIGEMIEMTRYKGFTYQNTGVKNRRVDFYFFLL